MLYLKFKKIGEKLFLRGFNSSHSGNISVRQNDSIFITATGSGLDELTEKDIVQVGLHSNEERDKKASMELLVHRAIYHANSEIKAVVHAHTPYAVVVADGNDAIIPYEQEGAYYFKQIPVMHVKNAIASPEVAANIGQYVKNSNLVIVAKHGIFAWGVTLEKAYQFLTVAESTCRINYLLGVQNAAKNHRD